jgi:hypothetical protein
LRACVRRLVSAAQLESSAGLPIVMQQVTATDVQQPLERCHRLGKDAEEPGRIALVDRGEQDQHRGGRCPWLKPALGARRTVETMRSIASRGTGSGR